MRAILGISVVLSCSRTLVLRLVAEISETCVLMRAVEPQLSNKRRLSFIINANTSTACLRRAFLFRILNMCKAHALDADVTSRMRINNNVVAKDMPKIRRCAHTTASSILLYIITLCTQTSSCMSFVSSLRVARVMSPEKSRNYRVKSVNDHETTCESRRRWRCRSTAPCSGRLSQRRCPI